MAEGHDTPRRSFVDWFQDALEENHGSGKPSIKRIILLMSFLLYAFVVICAVFMPHALTPGMIESIKQGFYISCALVGGPQMAEAITSRLGGGR